MENLRDILLWHAARYPQMQPTDAVKLIYQNEFGGAHLIRDEQLCRDLLHREYARTPQRSAVPLAEEIGNGILRIRLDALDCHGCTPDLLADAFIRSSRSRSGTLDSFLDKLELLRQLTAEGLLPFSPEALEAYLNDYARAGYPMVSHSDQYRDAYRPAYRILRKEFLPEILPRFTESLPHGDESFIDTIGKM